MHFGFTRIVRESYIDMDKMRAERAVDPEVETSPSGYVPTVVVPRDYIGRKVLVVVLEDDDTPASFVEMMEHGLINIT